MKILKQLNNFITNPLIRFGYLTNLGLTHHISDEKYLKKKFKLSLGYELDLKNPQTLNEKLQWLKLYDRKPEYTTMVDKYAVKKYVADKIGEQYIIPTLGVWDKFEDINFDKLPEQFVLKCTHDSGGLVICRDKSEFDIEAARKKINRCLERNYYWGGREWPYKNVPRKIIAEEYLDDEINLVPKDYKVYCFNGKPKYIVVFHNRFNDNAQLSETVYNTQWEYQSISLDNHFAISDIVEAKPKCLTKMLENAEVLCKNFAIVRIDFYIINDILKFGEITLHTASGFQAMNPPSLDNELGKLIELPKKRV